MLRFRFAAVAGSWVMISACAPDRDLLTVGDTGLHTPAPLFSASPERKISGAYIVVLKDDADPDAVLSERAVKAKKSYRHALKGFAADLSPEQVAELRGDPAVAFIEEDQMMYMDATQSNATWGIDRTDQRALPLSATFTYNATGTGVRAYIIDSGILTGHTQFGSRAGAVYDAIGDGRNGQDCNGHGTHVAATVGGSTYGIAKNVYLRAVRVFGCTGRSSNSTIISGIDWVAKNHLKPAVANLSLGGGYSSTLNTAVTNLANAGVFVAVAAGNDNQHACNYSPASASAVTTVAATTSGDYKASYSNYGSCVDLYGPGSSITSAWYTSTTATNTISGTSMATPHVAGVAALYKGAYGDASQSTIDSWLKNNSTANVIKSNVTGTPNRLLYKSSL